MLKAAKIYEVNNSSPSSKGLQGATAYTLFNQIKFIQSIQKVHDQILKVSRPLSTSTFLNEQ